MGTKYDVNIDLANETKKEMVKTLATDNDRVLNKVGAFASLYDIKYSEYEEPILVLKTEEPGSKQLIAVKYDKIENVCFDMINHLVNDCIVMGKIMEDNPEIMNERIGGKTFIEAILEPHRCYYKTLKELLGKPHRIHGLAHITGGGICENLNRILPDGLDAENDLSTYRVLDIFKVLKKLQ